MLFLVFTTATFTYSILLVLVATIGYHVRTVCIVCCPESHLLLVGYNMMVCGETGEQICGAAFREPTDIKPGCTRQSPYGVSCQCTTTITTTTTTTTVWWRPLYPTRVGELRKWIEWILAWYRIRYQLYV